MMTSRSASTRASSGSWVTSDGGPPYEVARWRCRSRAQVQPGAGVQRGERLVEQQQPGRRARARASATRWACPPESCRGRRPAWSARPTRSSQSAALGPGRGLCTPAGRAARRRRCPARSGAGRAGSPGTRRRPAALGRRRTPRSGRRGPAVERDVPVGRAAPARPAPAARWSCRRRWGRAARPPRRPATAASRSSGEGAAVDDQVRVEQRHGRPAASSTAVAQRWPGWPRRR